MKAEDTLIRILTFVTEGKNASLPRRLAKPEFKEEKFLADVERLRKQARPWTQGRGIVGIGIGSKETRGMDTGRLALCVYVRKKLPRAKVTNPIPARVSIPGVGSGVTDIKAVGPVRTHLCTSRIRPAPPGCGISLWRQGTGTFGCLVHRKHVRQRADKVYVLSNSHVIADCGRASVGDNVLQPGYIDGGIDPADAIATLDDWVPFIYTATGYPNRVDAAVARVIRKSLVTGKIRLLGIQPTSVNTRLTRGMAIKKVGRTSDLTCGAIQDIHFHIGLKFKKPGGGSGRVGFSEQVLCSHYAERGDSGALVLDQRDRAVGLHFAGSDSVSIFNRISNVFQALDVSLAMTR